MTRLPIPRTTTTRLLAVADAIERYPDHHSQDEFWDTDAEPIEVAGRGWCETTACVAGWAVALAPKTLVGSIVPYFDRLGAWGRAGAAALGLENSLAEEVFYGWGNDTDDIPDRLRLIATIPEGSRTVTAYYAALEAP